MIQRHVYITSAFFREIVSIAPRFDFVLSYTMLKDDAQYQ